MLTDNLNVKVRKLLDVQFRTDADFTAFVLDYFPATHQRFSSGMDRLSKTSLLLEVAGAEEILRKLYMVAPRTESAHSEIRNEINAILAANSSTITLWRRLWPLALISVLSILGVAVWRFSREKQPASGLIPSSSHASDLQTELSAAAKQTGRFVQTLPTSARVDMIHIPPGSYLIGSIAGEDSDDIQELHNELPSHAEHLLEFDIDQTEVTVLAYEECVKSGHCKEYPTVVNYDGYTPQQLSGYNSACNGRGKMHLEEPPTKRMQHPMNCVDFTQAETYCLWAGKRLPSEAEWEAAARGENRYRYPWGEAPPTPDRLNACDSTCQVWLSSIRDRRKTMFAQSDGWANTAPVKSFPRGASPSGLFDMAGNVWEWTASPYCGNYSNKCSDSTTRVGRGGAWDSGSAYAIRASHRFGFPLMARYSTLGFRCVRSRYLR